MLEGWVHKMHKPGPWGFFTPFRGSLLWWNRSLMDLFYHYRVAVKGCDAPQRPRLEHPAAAPNESVEQGILGT